MATTGLLYFPIVDAEDDSGPTHPGSKRRRLRGACDTCRQRKIRCDSAKMPGNVCSNCVAFNSQCTHGSLKPDSLNKHSKWRSVSTGKGPAPSVPPSAQDLPETAEYQDKTAQEHVDAILVQSTAYIATDDLRKVLLDVARYSRNLEEQLEQCKSHSISPSSSMVSPVSTPYSSNEKDAADPKSDEILVLCDGFDHLALDPKACYFGWSSGANLLQSARHMLKIFHEEKKPGCALQPPNTVNRLEFWTSPWERTPLPPPPVYRFPSQDLLDSLVSLYFQRINIVLCLLHRPTFESSIASGRHLRDHSFGAVVLAVCALASRYSDDPRVILKGTDSKLSAGWEYFRQLQYFRTNFRLTSTLHDLQLVFLSIIYLQGTSSPEPCWVLVAIGIRNMQEIGLHMRRGEENSVENELYKRAFWLLICTDAFISAFLGRPRVTTDDDYDVDYPVECDDEYWENPDPQKRFQQPEGKPSVYGFFTKYLKLMEILGTAQKTIYSVKRTKRSSEWSQTAVVELDSALNQWLDSIPDHLRWDPHRQDEIFATQSACLFAAYYHVQIQIHRSFIPSPENDASLCSSFPSLAICANSARSCSHVMDVQAKRGLVAHPQVISALMDSAIFLLLNVWRNGTSTDPQRAAIDVQKCISVLQMYEHRWQTAGRLCDILFTIGNQLIINAFASQAPSSSNGPTLKRSRNGEATNPKFPASELQERRNIAGTRRVSAATQQQHESSTTVLDHMHALPISTEELGHLPVYESFDWGIPLGSDFLDLGPSFNFEAPQDGDFSPITGADASQYNVFAQHIINNTDWATRDWTTSVDSADQIMQYLDSNGVSTER
ncbi:fungal-specific transcription factor domain-containing protein [Mycena galericulata]|nr:fungal-specific transcription factor domain-containing protein [Mycena galericulata]